MPELSIQFFLRFGKLFELCSCLKTSNKYASHFFRNMIFQISKAELPNLLLVQNRKSIGICHRMNLLSRE